jgi:predicted RNase H-like nuclease
VGTAVGLDGTPGGWIAVVVRDDRVATARRMPDLASVISRYPAVPIAVDIPIGLVDEPQREADVAARSQLSHTASSVFAAPCRSVVDAYRAGSIGDHAAANALSRRVTGAGLSRQSWGIVPKIAEADAQVERGVRLYEVHPELSFRLLAGRPLAGKRTWNGVMARLALLRAHGVELPPAIDGGERVPPDDVFDAAVIAWTAAGVHHPAGLRSHPVDPRQHDRGLSIAIWTRA